jgi:hypothetical protein
MALGQAETAGGVLCVHDGKVEPQPGFEARQVVQHGLAAGFSDDVSEECDFHGATLCTRPAKKKSARTQMDARAFVWKKPAYSFVGREAECFLGQGGRVFHFCKRLT